MDRLLDTGTMSALLLVLMVLLIVIALLIVRYVATATRRVAWVALAGAVFVGSWWFRTELATCAQTCDCQILAHELDVPACSSVAGKIQQRVDPSDPLGAVSDTPLSPTTTIAGTPAPQVVEPRTVIPEPVSPVVVTSTTLAGGIRLGP
jgi:hypothetical protein